jgi:hypothetical protein
MMKRKASKTELEYQSPPQCGFNKEEGFTKRELHHLHGCDEERTIRDIYGIEEVVDENPCFLKEMLHRLECELDVFSGKMDALMKAKNCNPSPLDNNDFMLRFLRAEKYNAKLAARRIAKHFEKKLELFGEEKLGKKISISDLDHDDLETLHSGGFQPLTKMDAGGRVIIFERFQNLRYKNAVNLFRIVWYVSMAAIEEQQSHRGLVVVSFQNGPFSPDLFDRVVYKQTINLIRLLPVKLVGYHFCFDDIRFRMVWGLATIYIGKEARLRARDHEGTPYECRYGLLSYGIPVDELPISVEGVDDNSTLLKWIEDRKKKEERLFDPYE